MGEKVRALSGSTGLTKQEVAHAVAAAAHHEITKGEKGGGEGKGGGAFVSAGSASHGVQTRATVIRDDNQRLSGGSAVGGGKYQPRPLPMPEYGGWFAPLTEFLPEASVPISNFHRCNLALILLTDLVVDGLDLDCHSVDWSVHMPLMLHIIFLGLDNNKEMIYRHCHQLLLNLLIVLGQHSDHLTVSSILMNGQIEQVWPLTQFFLLPFCELPMIPHLGKYLSLLLFQPAPSYLSRILEGFF